MSDQPLSDRQSNILKLLKDNGSVSVDFLSEAFAVTTQTIRRDVNRLGSLGLVQRFHGGVELPRSPRNIAYGARKILNRRAKLSIAAHAAHHIPNHASVAFSIGTTPEIVAGALGGHDGLKVFTNNMNVAVAALKNPSSHVTIAGGRLRHDDCDVLGYRAEDFFRGYKFDIGIFGVAGVDSDGTLLDFHEEEVAARTAILKNCREAFLVLDSSKFGRQAHVRGGWITDVSKVFVDHAPPSAIVDCLNTSGTELVICNQDLAA
ncbi:DeoR/GlpR family DNA-binding transcription regulator [Pseudovibrio flavus]|uniref:DeoR/GlpR family DNA-binding transcription regulator n=1 Tax=Pseudovibrio flavus TaxID=2529854 RepID=UPI003527CF94